MERYFLEPYRFIPPFRSTVWCRLARPVVNRHLRRTLGVVRTQFAGVEHLCDSLDRGAGILLTPNHCRWADPMLMSVLGRQVRRFFYYVASYHLFRQSRFEGWLLNRLGGYSIWREGMDREAIRTTARLLADAERPVVLFPEGTWFRQNDRVGPLQDGLALITRQAARQSTRPILVHPVGIKYWLLGDPLPEIRRRLDVLERRLGWRPQGDTPPVVRVERIGGALLALKEIEYLGQPQSGGLDERIRRLSSSQVERMEAKHLGRTFDGWLLERIRRLRQHLSRQLMDKAVTDASAAAAIKADMDVLLFCENLNAQSLDYLLASPTPERLAETVQRIEETVADQVETPIARTGATVHVGPAVDVRTFDAGGNRRGPDPLVQHLRQAMQGLVDRLVAAGPPADWGCLPRPTASLPPRADTTAPANGQVIG